MRLHNVLFRLSALISRLSSLCSEDEANTQHFLVRCSITLSQCLFAASKVDPLSPLLLEHLIIHKGHSEMKSKAEGRRDEANYFAGQKCLLSSLFLRYHCHSSMSKLKAHQAIRRNVRSLLHNYLNKKRITTII